MRYFLLKAYDEDIFCAKLIDHCKEGWQIAEGQQVQVTYLGEKTDHNQPTYSNKYDKVQYSLLIKRDN